MKVSDLILFCAYVVRNASFLIASEQNPNKMCMVTLLIVSKCTNGIEID